MTSFQHKNTGDCRRQRMKRLSLRRLQLASRSVSISAGMVIIAILLLGAKEKPEAAEFQSVTTKMIRVVDDRGNLVFSVSCKDGMSTLILSSPQAKDTGVVQLTAKQDQGAVYVSGAGQHSFELISSKALNFFDLQTKNRETILVNGTDDAGSITISQNPINQASKKLWSAP